jgi:hypothetical protein
MALAGALLRVIVEMANPAMSFVLFSIVFYVQKRLSSLIELHSYLRSDVSIGDFCPNFE